MLLPHKTLLSGKRFVLASASPRRKEALTLMVLPSMFNHGIRADVIPSTFAEDLDKSRFPTTPEYVVETARCKALDVWNRLKAEDRLPDVLVAVDTVVSKDNEIIEKPASGEHAINMLQSLSGRSHDVYSGVAIFCLKGDSYHAITFSERTEVTFSNLTRETIAAYVATGSPMDKAGGYGIQDGMASTFVSGIKGDYWNVTGFPMHRFSVKLVELIEANIIKRN